ncbi:DUF3379 domain-containing protein [Shewanella cyperi]|uniref:DUF3379 domain-containing protein n=1 Tax=Shewanella cyperi TaxID=2814292 RepID=UPI001A9440F8|nr:DUF3379 domain-containing protein [Shewanella cyperi]QSX39585.1 DUF3379 domain-containing protein [Shewanella cyperi]
MDELEFRRRAYSDPQSQDPEFLAAMAEEENRGAFVRELKQLDAKLARAMNVDVPETLAARLLLRQQLLAHRQSKRRTTWLMAMAASIAFVIGLGFSWLRLGPVDLGEHALAHVHHEPMALTMEQAVDLPTLNASLASISGLKGAHFNALPGKVVFKAFCDFRGVQSIHLVLEGENGKTTLFIVPLEERMQLSERFADSTLKGLGFRTRDAFLMLVGDEQQSLTALQQTIRQDFI